VAEVMTRQSEHREQGLKELQALADEPSDNPIAHRSLGYAHIQKKEFKQANDELAEALDIKPNDPWVRYYLALLRVRMEQASGQPIEGGLANVQQGLRVMIDTYPDFAEAYRLLGLAELEGGGINAALDNIRLAIQLSPRNQGYVMNLADIYLAGKKWDNGQSVLERLKTSSDPHIASAAKKKLDDLPFLKKYGITPDRAPDAQKTRTIEANSGISNPLNDDDEDAKPKLKERPSDKRPVQFLKGKIVSVDCSQTPGAVVTMTTAGRTIKLHTSDYKALVLMGSDQFSCDWKNRAASANYRSSNKTEGDLVSLEVD
jgi:tetratricopeptide (TPR) repeat protein